MNDRYGNAIDLLGELSRYQVVHFAGHAMFDRERPELSALLLDRAGVERITAQNIANLSVTPVLVFLNACESGRQTGWGEAQQFAAGLADAFVTSGSHNVVATYWRIEDESAQGLALAFYQTLLEGEPLGAALHAARRHVFERQGWTDLT